MPNSTGSSSTATSRLRQGPDRTDLSRKQLYNYPDFSPYDQTD